MPPATYADPPPMRNGFSKGLNDEKRQQCPSLTRPSVLGPLTIERHALDPLTLVPKVLYEGHISELLEHLPQEVSLQNETELD